MGYASLASKVVVVTGAAGNLGTAVVDVFSENGAKLALLELDATRLQSSLKPSDNILVMGNADVTNAESVQTAIDAVKKHFGTIDILVNIAGGYRAGKPVHETDVDTWDFMMNLNAKSVFLMGRAVAPIMLTGGHGGAIISVGATPGLEGGKGSAAYSASKAAVFRITESMAKELKADGIRVNAVYPNMIDTPQNREAMPDADFSKWVQPSSIAGIIAFLASDEARDITGALIPIFGRT